MTTGFDSASIDSTGYGLTSRYADIGTDAQKTSDTRPTMPVPHLNSTFYTKKNTPRFADVGRMPDPYYYNGPRYAPWQRGQSDLAQQTALANVYMQPEKAPIVARFGSLFRNYGSTNSPGVLWALAQNGDTWDDQTIANLLDLDARAVQRNAAGAGPVKPGSPNGQAQDQQDNSMWENAWSVPQAVARNSFSLLSAPMEAIQGGVRTAGGALAQPQGPDFLKSALGLGSIIPGIGLIGDAIYGDNNFQDAWEQTDAGQQAIDFFNGGGMSAFQSGTAGVDYDAAWNEIHSNPEYSGYAALIQQDPSRASELLTKVGQEQNLYSNAGWFIEETSRVGEAQRQATFDSWAIPYGKNNELTAWTLGRGITSAALPPGHTASMGLSGIIDAAASIFGDPTIIGSKFGAVSKTARAAGILLDAKGAPLKALETARNDVRELGKAEQAFTFGKEKRRVTAAFTQRKQVAEIARTEWNKTHPDEEPITAQAWEGMSPEEQLRYTQDGMKAQAATDASKAARPDIDRTHDAARDVRRAESRAHRAQQAAATAPFTDTLEHAQQQADLWEGMSAASRLTKPRPETTVKPREWAPVEQPKTEPLTWATPEQAAPKPRELTLEDSGSGAWHVKWGDEVIGTSTSKNGAASMRRRILKKDAEDNQFDSALASGRGIVEAGGYRIAPGADGRVTMTSPDGAKRTFASAEKAKAAAEKEAAGPPAPLEFTYGDITVSQHPDGYWTVVGPNGRWKMANQSIAQRWAEKKAAEADDVPMTVYSAKKYEAWVDSLTPEQQQMWQDSVAHFNTVVKDGTIEGLDWSSPHALDDAVKAYTSHIRTQAEATAAAQTPRAGKYADQADRAAAQLILDNNAGTETLEGVDSAGVTLQYVPEQGVFQRAIHDGADVVSTWAGDKPPVLYSADDAILPHEGQEVYDFLAGVINRRPLREAKITNPDSVAGQVGDTINRTVGMLPLLQQILTVPGKNWRQAFRVASRMGIEGYLDDALRSIGVDGLSEVNAANRAGVWMGDHPLMESYLFPENAVDNAELAGGIADPAAADEFLSGLPRVAQPFGLRTETQQGLSQYAVIAERNRADAVKAYDSSVGSSLMKADAIDTNLAKTHAEIDARFEDPEEALRSILRYDAGIGRNFMAGHTIDMQKAAWFLSGNSLTGRYMTRTLDALASFIPKSERAVLAGLEEGSDEWASAAAPWLGRLSLLTNHRWSPELLKDVLRNSVNDGGKEGLLRALAPHVGMEVQPGSLPLRVRNTTSTALRSYRTPSSDAVRTMRRLAGQRPGLTPLAINSTEQVVDNLTKYMTFAKVPTEDIARMVGQVIIADGDIAQVEKNTRTLFDSFNLINDGLVAQMEARTKIFSGPGGQDRLLLLKDRMRQSTRLTYGGKSAIQRSGALRMGHGPEMVMDEFGHKVEMPPLMLESELSRGMMMLPSVDEWGAAVSTMGSLLSRFGFSEQAFKYAQQVYDGLFRTSLLIFRGAYIARNSGEMQFRMFLNGHESVFADPMTMFAMTIGNRAARGKDGKLAEAFSPYSNTVLGDEFIAPADYEDAIAAHMEDYWATTRDGLSLGDPRTFGSAATSKFEMMGFDSPNFADGWANELITMHNSRIIRVALGDVPHDFATSGQFNTLEDASVAWMMSDHPMAVQTRARLEASDDAWKTLFSSEQMVREYLFDSPNSVRNRVQDFTMGDQTLTDFLRTGVWEGNGERWQLKGDVKARVGGVAARLRSQYLNNQKKVDEARAHFETNNVFVPYVDRNALEKRGIGAIDAFFYVANRIERLGTMGPEFRLTYWDEIAKLAPMLRGKDIDTALEAARTTLSPLKRMTPEGTLDGIGANHPAFEALQKAKNDGTDSLLSIEQAHEIAMQTAAKETKALFYNAARRNTFWSAMRLIFPFGQAWGNTIWEWGRLASKNPVQVYKVQKAFNAAQERGSTAAYDVFDSLGLVNDYADGMAPWDVDPGGGFLYSDEYGNQRFMQPGMNITSLMPQIAGHILNGTPMGGIDASSTTDSLNVALGSDSPVPGVSPFVTTSLDFLPDGDITDGLKNIFNPYGANDMTDAIPRWIGSSLAGLSDVPVVGSFAQFLSPLSGDIKNKNVQDATVILASNGQYNINDPLDMQRMKEDVQHLAASFSIIEGTGKNLSPTSPRMEQAMTDKDGRVIALGLLDRLYAADVENNGGDRTAAKADMIARYGLPVLFALTGNRKGFNSTPSGEALQWARSNPANMAAFRANPDEIVLFFPKGDPSDLIARGLMERLTGRVIEYKTPQEQVDDVVGTLAMIERAGVTAQLANGKINSEQATAAKDDITSRYQLTSPGTSFNSKSGTDQANALRAVWVKYPTIQQTPVGATFDMAWRLRSDALVQARVIQGDDRAGLAGKNVRSLKAAYISDLEGLVAGNPAFAPLAEVLMKEFN